MSRADETPTESERPRRPTRAQRLVAAGFLGAFGLTMITVLLTGLEVGARRARQPPEPAPVAVPSAVAPAPTAAARPPEARAAEPAPGAAAPHERSDEAEKSARAREGGEPSTRPAR